MLGDGVGIFLCDSFEFKRRHDLESTNCDVLESIFLEILQPDNDKNLEITSNHCEFI